MKNKYTRLVRLESLRDNYRNKFYIEIGRCQAYRDSDNMELSDKSLMMADIFCTRMNNLGNAILDYRKVLELPK